jgi:hypothetical protein
VSLMEKKPMTQLGMSSPVGHHRGQATQNHYLRFYCRLLQQFITSLLPRGPIHRREENGSRKPCSAEESSYLNGSTMYEPPEPPELYFIGRRHLWTLNQITLRTCRVRGVQPAATFMNDLRGHIPAQRSALQVNPPTSFRKCNT